MNRLDDITRSRVLACIVEGMGSRAAGRATGVAFNTVQKLIHDAGPLCERLHRERVRGLACKKIECDEAWAFVYARAKNVPAHKKGDGSGDVWIWTALDPASKIIPAWTVGGRGRSEAFALLTMLRDAVPKRFELNTDGHNAYWSALGVLNAAKDANDPGVDYARVVKKFQTPNERWNDRDNRYAQPALKSLTKERICGNPDMAHAGTSRSERMNLSLRMQNGKLSRLSNKFAKWVTMLAANLAIYYAYYNWCRPHLGIGGKTPAMENGLTDHRWTIAELLAEAAKVEISK